MVFLFLLFPTSHLKARHTSGNSAAPNRLVLGYCFSTVKINAAMFPRSLQRVLISLPLTSKRALAFIQLTVKQSLWQTLIRHSEYVPCPSELETLEKRMNALHFSSLEYLCVKNFVLPFDVKQFSKVSHVERI